MFCNGKNLICLFHKKVRNTWLVKEPYIMVRSVLSFLGYFEQNSIKEKLDSKKLIGYTCIGNHKGKQRNHKRLAKTIQILILTVSLPWA